jgi:hypothetical protein
MEIPPMTIPSKWTTKLSLCGFLLAGLVASSASAQNMVVRPSPITPNVNNAYNIGAVQGLRNGYSAGFNNGAYSSPYYGGGWYNSTGAALSGAADVINSQGNFLIQNEQSWLLHEQQKQERTKTRRMTFDERMYEQANTPSNEDLREKERVTALRRSLNNPPQNEIWSGLALNNILESVQRDTIPVSLRPIIPLSPETLNHINSTSGTTAGSIGLIRDGGKLSWPLSLKSADFGTDRSKMDELASKAIEEASRGAVQAETLQGMTGALDNLREALREKVNDMSLTDNMAGRRYLNELENTISALQDPNVSKHVSRSWAKANSVSELVDQFTRQGIKFAAASPGDEPSYSSLYQSFVAYTSGLSQLRAQKPPQE